MGRKRWDREKGEIEEQEETTTEPQAAASAEPEPVPEGVDPATGEDTTTAEPEKPAEPEPGPLTKLQAAIQELLDYDQITEIRLALYSRETELEKHVKKGSDLGVREEDARRRLRIVRGSDERFGLVRIFAEEIATEQRDVFFDREKANGRPDAQEVTDCTITFRTVDGRDVTCTLQQLQIAERLLEVQALYRAGILPSHVETALREQGFWHLVEEAGEPVGAGA